MRVIANLIGLVLISVATAALAHGEAEHKGPVKAVQTEWGIAGKTGAARRSIEIKMLDTMRFAPDEISVKQGETVKLVLKNEGAMLHEFVLGTAKELEAHAAMMLKMPDMQHSAPYMAHVPAGASKTIVWTFNRAGSFDFACLLPGHFQAGMRGRVLVVR